MATGALVSINEYLSTSYDPDCDYVDGVIEERNSGEFDHASLQTAIAIYLGSRQKQWGVWVVVEQRVQVSPLHDFAFLMSALSPANGPKNKSSAPLP